MLKNFILLIILFPLIASLSLAQEINVVPDEYIVTYKPHKLPRNLLANFTVKRSLNNRNDINLIEFNTPPSRRSNLSFVEYSAENNKCAQILTENSDIISCIPNYFFRTTLVPNDPFYSTCVDETCICSEDFDIENDDPNDSQCLWSLNNAVDTDINAPEAWDITTGSSDTIIAVIDTGIDYLHPDINANVWENPGEIPDNDIDDDLNGYVDDIYGITTATGSPNAEGDPFDDHGHGTHVAGTVAAIGNNNQGTTGVSWNSKVMAVKTLRADGGGTAADAIEAINYVVKMVEDFNQNVIAINASWGGSIPPEDLNGENGLIATINAANAAGILFVAAAGNDSLNIDSIPHYPASVDSENMIAVASTNYYGRLSSFSNYGPNSVHLAAPGSNIRSLLLTGSNFGDLESDGTTVTSGTSMAAPHVSGILALMQDHFPALDHNQLKDRLLNRVKPFALEADADQVITGGSANAFYALTDGEIPVPDPLPEPEPEPTPTPVVPDPTPVPTPISTPEPEETITQSDLVYDLEALGKAPGKRRRAKFKKRLYEKRPYKILISTIAKTNLSEELKIVFSIKGQECSDNIFSFTTNQNSEAILRGKLPKLPKKTRRLEINLLDSQNNVRASVQTKIVRSKKGKKPKKVPIACEKLNLRQVT